MLILLDGITIWTWNNTKRRSLYFCTRVCKKNSNSIRNIRKIILISKEVLASLKIWNKMFSFNSNKFYAKLVREFIGQPTYIAHLSTLYIAHQVLEHYIENEPVRLHTWFISYGYWLFIAFLTVQVHELYSTVQ